MARYEGFARASGPVAVAVLYDQAGAVSVFGSLSMALLLMAPISWAVVSRRREPAAMRASTSRS